MKIPYFNNGGRFVVKYQDGGWWKSGVKYNTGMSANDYAKAIANILYNAENSYNVSGNSSGLDLAKRMGYTGHINKSVSDLTNLILRLPNFNKNYTRWVSNNTTPKGTSTPTSKPTTTTYSPTYSHGRAYMNGMKGYTGSNGTMYYRGNDNRMYREGNGKHAVLGADTKVTFNGLTMNPDGTFVDTPASKPTPVKSSKPTTTTTPQTTTTTTPQAPTIAANLQQTMQQLAVPSVNYYERNRDRLSNNYNSAYWTQHNTDTFNQSLNSSNFDKDQWNINFQGKDTNIVDAISNMYGDTYKGRRFAKRLDAGKLKAKDFRRLGQAQATYNRNQNLNNLSGNSNLEATPQQATYSDVFNMTTGKVNQPSNPASYKVPPIDSSLDGSPDYTDKNSKKYY